MITMATMAAMIPMLMFVYSRVYSVEYGVTTGYNNPGGGTICRRSCHSLKSVKS